MKTSSAKAKGRKVASLLRDYILNTFLHLDDNDVNITSSSETGEDLKLSSKARIYFPYSIECKARNSIAVYKWLEQAANHNKEYPPIVIAKGDRKEPIVILYLKDFKG